MMRVRGVYNKNTFQKLMFFLSGEMPTAAIVLRTGPKTAKQTKKFRCCEVRNAFRGFEKLGPDVNGTVFERKPCFQAKYCRIKTKFVSSAFKAEVPHQNPPGKDGKFESAS